MITDAKPSPLQRLLRKLLHWVRRAAGLAQPDPPGTLEAVSDVATLWRIPSAEPGVVDCWWLCHRYAAADLVISVISIARMREDLAQRGHYYRRNSDPIRFSGRRAFKSELEDYLEACGGLDSQFISHIFVAAWRSRIPTPVAGSIDRRAYLVRPIAAIPCDLQGFTNAWSCGDRHAIRIAEVIARRLLRIKDDNTSTWEEAVAAIDWISWLEFYAQASLGKHHVLQPRKRVEDVRSHAD